MTTTTKTTEKNKKGRIFSYARWSSDRQTAGDSERRQLAMATDWCRRNGYVLEDQTYTDRGVSGAKGRNRLEGALSALLRIVKPGDKILIESEDRWSREPVMQSMSAIEATVNEGVDLVFLRNGITVNKLNFNDPGVLIPCFFGSWMANRENESRRARVQEAMNNRRKIVESGRAVPGKLPAWIDWNREKGEPVVNTQKAAVVKRLFELCIAGNGLGQIERLMKDTPPITYRATFTKQKTAWNTFFIHRTLADRSVLGYQRSSGVKIYPPVIDEGTFYTAQAKLKARKKLTVKIKHQNSSLFTSLVRCGKCGATYVRQRTIAKGRNYDYLICSGYLHHTTRCKHPQGVNYNLLENSFLELVGHSKLFGLALFGQTEPSRVDAIVGELEDTRKQIEKYVGLIETDDCPSPRLVQNLKLLEVKEARLQQEIQIAQAQTAIPADQAINEFNNYLANDAKNRSRLREIMRDFVDKIIITQGGRNSEYEVHLRGAKRPVTVLLRQNGWLFSGIDALPGKIPR
ncbi:MAG: recombinase family protein [Limisphaerales bacterium]